MMFKPSHLGKKNSNKAPAKPKATFASAPMHKVSSSVSTTSGTGTTAAEPETMSSISSTPQQVQQQQSAQQQKRGFEDWAASGDDDWSYYMQKKEQERAEARNKKKKKKKGKQNEEQAWSWGDIYDPHAPVSFLDYPKSEVQFDINEQWKERLYEARRRERLRREKEAKRPRSEGEGSRNRRTPHVQRGMLLTGAGVPSNVQFAPPGSLNFAPPADLSSDVASPAQPAGTSSPQPARNNSSETGDGAVNQRMAPPPNFPAQGQPVRPGPPPVPQAVPRTSGSPAATAGNDAQAKAQAQIAAFKAKLAAQKTAQGTAPTQNPPAVSSASPPAMNTPPPPPPPPPQDAPAAAAPGVISAAPTYNPEYARMKAEQDASNAAEQEQQPGQPDLDAPRSNRPGQMGFAEKYMAKHGHQKGQGLGAQGDGILTPIMLQQNKRKKRPDAEGGGFAAPATGRIIGGKRAKTTANSGSAEDAAEAPPTMTEVVKISGMLTNLDVDQEIQDKGLLQEIGEEMGTYGTVERLFIWRQHAGGNDDVFVKYTSPLSAMNAIRACDGQEFADNVMVARFWDAEAFERGEYA